MKSMPALGEVCSSMSVDEDEDEEDDDAVQDPYACGESAGDTAAALAYAFVQASPPPLQLTPAELKEQMVLHQRQMQARSMAFRPAGSTRRSRPQPFQTATADQALQSAQVGAAEQAAVAAAAQPTEGSKGTGDPAATQVAGLGESAVQAATA